MAEMQSKKFFANLLSGERTISVNSGFRMRFSKVQNDFELMKVDL